MHPFQRIVLVLIVFIACAITLVNAEVRIGDGVLPSSEEYHRSLGSLHREDSFTNSPGEIISPPSGPFFSQVGETAGSQGLPLLQFQNNSEGTNQFRVEFSAAPTSGRVPLMVQFIDLSRGNPTSWLWDFGDDSSAIIEDPLHTYVRGGVYTVSLTVSGPEGSGTRVKEGYITVNPVPLQARFIATPSKGEVPLTVQFTDQSVGAMIWFWDFGDGSTGSMIPNPTHTYQQPGTYTAKLTVSNGIGESETGTMDIEVSAPGDIHADFVGIPLSGYVPLTVRFEDKSEGTPTMWLWDFGDGDTASVGNPVHTYTQSGVYTVTLTVTNQYDNSGTECKEGYIQVLDNLPVTGSIPLSSGWNFISVPKILESGKDTAAIFEKINTDDHSAFRYNPELMQWVSLSRTTPIIPLDGIWLYSKAPDSVPLVFSSAPVQVPPARVVKKGWNAIGITGFDPIDARSALISVKDTWMYCLGFNSNYQRYDEMIIKGQSDTTNLKPYCGYWLYMSSDGVLTSP